MLITSSFSCFCSSAFPPPVNPLKNKQVFSRFTHLNMKNTDKTKQNRFKKQSSKVSLERETVWHFCSVNYVNNHWNCCWLIVSAQVIIIAVACNFKLVLYLVKDFQKPASFSSVPSLSSSSLNLSGFFWTWSTRNFNPVSLTNYVKRYKQIAKWWTEMDWLNIFIKYLKIIFLSLVPRYCTRFHFFTSKLTLTLMILLLKLFNTTIMSSESAGESVPSWLQQKKDRRKRWEQKVFTTQSINPSVTA